MSDSTTRLNITFDGLDVSTQKPDVMITGTGQTRQIESYQALLKDWLTKIYEMKKTSENPTLCSFIQPGQTQACPEKSQEEIEIPLLEGTKLSFCFRDIFVVATLIALSQQESESGEVFIDRPAVEQWFQDLSQRKGYKCQGINPSYLAAHDVNFEQVPPCIERATHIHSLPNGGETKLCRIHSALVQTFSLLVKSWWDGESKNSESKVRRIQENSTEEAESEEGYSSENEQIRREALGNARRRKPLSEKKSERSIFFSTQTLCRHSSTYNSSNPDCIGIADTSKVLFKDHDGKPVFFCPTHLEEFQKDENLFKRGKSLFEQISSSEARPTDTKKSKGKSVAFGRVEQVFIEGEK